MGRNIYTPKTRMELVEDLVADLVIARGEGLSQDDLDGDDLINVNRPILFEFWESHDPSSTISGDIVARAFPNAAQAWEENHV